MRTGKINAFKRDTPDSGKTSRTHCCSTWDFRGTSSRCCTGWCRSLSYRKPSGNSPVFGGHLSGDRSRSDWRSKKRCYYPGVCSIFAGTDSCRQILQRTPGPRWALPRELDKHRRGSAREKYRKPTGIKTKCCRRRKSILEKTFSDTKYSKNRNKNRRENQSTVKNLKFFRKTRKIFIVESLKKLWRILRPLCREISDYLLWESLHSEDGTGSLFKKIRWCFCVILLRLRERVDRMWNTYTCVHA